MADLPDDLAAELGAILDVVGARVTMDRHRSTQLPCYRCGTLVAARTLTKIGAYTCAFGGNLLPEDPIVRPLCDACAEAVRVPRSATSCQRCSYPRVITIQSHAVDMHSARVGTREHDGYLPHDLGLGGGDDLRVTYCLHCGQIQGEFPLSPCALEDDA